jgi:hypothetical protein
MERIPGDFTLIIEKATPYNLKKKTASNFTLRRLKHKTRFY